MWLSLKTDIKMIIRLLINDANYCVTFLNLVQLQMIEGEDRAGAAKDDEPVG